MSFWVRSRHRNMQARLGEQLSCPQNNYPGHRIVKGVSYVLLYGAVCIFLLFMDLCNSQEFTGIFRVSFTILISSFPSKQTQIFGLRQSSYASFPLIIFFRWTLFFFIFASSLSVRHLISTPPRHLESRPQPESHTAFHWAVSERHIMRAPGTPRWILGLVF